ncbi:hypothetical protein EBT31_05460 [bacterium]|nr:hypothetical protein [bacterium]NBT31172.1 hypothetical protein [Paracoccaceae bacterium]
MTTETQKLLFGRAGQDFITDTNTAKPSKNGSWFAITALTETVVDTCSTEDTTLNGSASAAPLAGLTLKAGTTLFLSLRSIKLTSGTVCCYLKAE